MYQYTTKDIARFWNKVNKTSEHPKGCWLWTDHLDKRGYGEIQMGGNRKNGGKGMKAHRVAWELTNGEIVDKLHVLHHCDNPQCVNPSHLFLGTQQDNIRDMVAKNRQQRKCGEEATLAKLTEDQVREIRRRYVYKSKDNNSVTLAVEFGVTPGTIDAILKYRTWKHVE